MGDAYTASLHASVSGRCRPSERPNQSHNTVRMVVGVPTTAMSQNNHLAESAQGRRTRTATVLYGGLAHVTQVSPQSRSEDSKYSIRVHGTRSWRVYEPRIVADRTLAPQPSSRTAVINTPSWPGRQLRIAIVISAGWTGAEGGSRRLVDDAKAGGSGNGLLRS